MLSKNNHPVQSKGFFAKAAAVVSGVFSPHPVSAEAIKESISKSKKCVERSEFNIAEHEKVQGECRKNILLRL